MKEDNGNWIMYGCEESDPECIHDIEELIAYVDEVGFLPLFQNEIPGFSVEERTVVDYWWTGDERDPWQWRETIAKSGRLAYGKFFDRKAGFISKEWLPAFVNYRREGYDFDARWEDELAPLRQKKIMDLFDDATELYSFEVKQKAGYGKGGEKNFEGMITALQMQTYLCVREFRQKLNKRGEYYGWPMAIYCKPEHLWGHEYVTSAYAETPEESKNRILAHMNEIYPIATQKQVLKLI